MTLRNNFQSKKQKRKFFSKNARKFFFESTLHGLKYIGDEDLSISERLYYTISFVIVCIFAVCLISNIYVKWSQSPVIVSINPSPTHINQIPFPAITICNMNQASRRKISNYSQSSLEYAMLQMLCLTKTNLEKYSHISYDNVKKKFSKFIIKSSQTCSQMLRYCEFGELTYNCNELFYENLADEGLCCVFNTVHPQFLMKGYFDYDMMKNFNPNDGKIPVDWSPENGYPHMLPKNFYPTVGRGTGVSMGLTVVLNAETEDYTCSSTNGAGFKVALHNPIDTPSIKETGLSVELGHETNFRIQPSHSEASLHIRKINKFDRRCLFNDEHTLLYYRYYTRHNCEMECDAMFMLATCNCIPYNMPLLFENATVCTLKDYGCIVKAERKYLTTDEENNKCKEQCLPACFDLSFTTEAFKSRIFNGEYLTDSFNLVNETSYDNSKNLAIIHFYYRDNMFAGSIRTYFIGLTDFFSSIGGLMGLFMGFSVISAAEIIYYVTQFLFKFQVRDKSNRRIADINLSRNFLEIQNVKKLQYYPKGVASEILGDLKQTENIGNLSKAAFFKSNNSDGPIFAYYYLDELNYISHV